MKEKTFTPRQTADFCRNLALLVQAGIGLNDGLFLMVQKENSAETKLLQFLGNQLDNGTPLSTAMKNSNVFPVYVTGMIQVGEQTGRLEGALNSLSDYYEDRCRTGQLLKNALVYPFIIMLLMLIVIGVLLVKVLPIFEEVYASLGTQLTGIGAGLLKLGQLLRTALPFLLIFLIILSVFFLVVVFCPVFRQKIISSFRLKIGDKGTFFHFNNAQFIRALSMGMISGLGLEESFELSETLLQEIPEAQKRCDRCRQLMKEDISLSEALCQTGFISQSDARMLKIGTKSGNADRVMKDIADRTMEDAEQRLQNRIMKVEPSIVMIASLLVGAILLSVMLPLANIMSSIG